MRSRAQRAWLPTRHRSGSLCDACGKTWGRAQEKLCASRNIMHRNLQLTQQKCLSRRAFSSIIIDMARESTGPSDREPDVHLAVGGRQEIAEGRCAARPRASSPGDAAGAHRRRRHRGGRFQAPPITRRRRLPSRDSRHGAGSGECVPRDAFRGRVIGTDSRRCALRGARHRARAGERRCPARTPQAVGESPPAR